MSQNEAWRLPQLGQACALCRAALAPGDFVTTRIRLLPTGPERVDVCAGCESRRGGIAVENAETAASDEFFWRRRLPEQAARKPVVDYALLRELFLRLLGRGDEVYRRLSYLVALVLVRKRFLRLIGFEQRAGREVMVVTRGAGQPPLEVPAPFLDAQQLLEVREHLTRLLNAELPEDDLPELSAEGLSDLQAQPNPLADSGRGQPVED
ncbi:MAG: hypothetical protein ACT4PU_02845 [Planctomycetota bacterium]